MRYPIRFMLLLLLLSVIVVLPVQADDDEPLQVTVSILPQQYFVERIGGDHVAVNVMVQPGEFPGTYEPTAQQLIDLSESVAYFSIDVPFERAWLDRFADANPDMLMVDTTQNIQRVGMQDHGTDLPDDYETPENPDVHIWLSPELVAVQAETIYEALAELDPDNETVYRENLDAFLEDIAALQDEINATLDGVENRNFIVFHPAWGYFAGEFGLTMIPIEVGGLEPSARELADLIKQAQDLDVSVIFAQPEFSSESAETIADQIGGEVMLISPLNPDWLENMRSVAATFANVLNAQS
ncbi:MAG: zinc ABC transporter solute-binding protein [Chloroflexi bacterium]|nr:zinc ABC transporter solute-binding protein [Chloroflexota bacterium]